MVYISYYIFGQLSDIAVDQYQSVTDDKGNGPMYKKKNLENISLDIKIIGITLAYIQRKTVTHKSSLTPITAFFDALAKCCKKLFS